MSADYKMAGCVFYNHSHTSTVNFDTYNMKAFIVLALIAVAAADVSHVVGHLEKDAVIVGQEADVLPDKFDYRYETSNGISGQESGVLINVGSENESIAVQGANSYTAPGGEKISLTYTADANGYHPEGAHLPTPPAPQEIPDYILRSLEYIKTHAPKEVRA